MSDPQFVIGVDLGTTNSAVAYADLRELTASGTPRVRVFDVPQLVAEGEIAPRETLPSFLYLLGPEERRSGRFAPPWAPDAPHVAGVWARDQGALVPGRLVSSAKSWLCNDAVDRRARLLPWGGEVDAASCSPVEASAAFLAHARDAWNYTFAGGRSGAPLSFERQSVTLTVPASFDEEARELTIEAARAAGFEHLTMIEEPTAALYAWIASHRGRLTDFLRDRDRVLICDVGGGTTDFTLVSVALDEDGPAFERIAVGEHLLLGGDNLDLALTGLVLDRLGNPRLTARQQQALRRRCAVVKERLLGPPPVDRETVSVLGSGAAVVGGALSVEVGREDVLRLLLDGFMPICSISAAPGGERRSGLRELGLPFASDPAVTRHLAAFLRSAEQGSVRPDVLLLNGGFFTPEEARARLVEVVSGWFANPASSTWAPRVLANRSPAVAVAEGAAYSGLVRRGLGLRIGGGSPRACFVALGGAPAGDHRRAVCVLPRGTREGTSHRLEGREFVVRTNRPLSFTLLSSLTSRASFGDVSALDAALVHRHAPLVTELRFGKRSRDTEVRTALEVIYTELGTLELWIVAPETGHRWRLQFQLRAAARIDSPAEEQHGRPSALVDPDALSGAVQLVKALFGGRDADTATTPDNLMGRLEEMLGFAKGAWPLGAVRPMADALIETVDGRGKSSRHRGPLAEPARVLLAPGVRRRARRLANDAGAAAVSRGAGVPERRPVPGGVARAVAARGRRSHPGAAAGSLRPPHRPPRRRGREAAEAIASAGRAGRAAPAREPGARGVRAAPRARP